MLKSSLKLTLLAILGLSLFSCSTNSTPQASVSPTPLSQETPEPSKSPISTVTADLTPAEQNWRENNHIHDIAVSPENPEILYVATHEGLLKRSEQGQWFRVGKSRDDYMGFTIDPTNSQRFYSSGHGATVHNLGFQVSENQGGDWKLVSMPGVDFHALAVSPSNPEIIYGWATSGNQGLFQSRDRGQTWQALKMEGLTDSPFNLEVDPDHENHLLAATRSGLFESRNGGNNWTLIADTQTAPIVGLTLLKTGDNTTLYGYRYLESEPGIYRSPDRGKTWEKLWTDNPGVIIKLTSAPTNSQIMYAADEKNNLYKSQDGGKKWQKLE